jgi:flavodoxin
MKTLVVYFSAESGRTRGVAESLAAAVEGDIFEIRPEKPYTAADLNYINPLSRCNREKFGKKKVPFVGDVENFESYDRVLIGFPIWYGGAPGVVNDFCKAHDFTGKKVAAFATSGGSGIGRTAAKLQDYVKGAPVIDARLFQSADPGPLKAWAMNL